MGSNQPSPRPLTFLLTMVVSSNLAKSPLSERIGSRSRNSKGACARERERNFDGISTEFLAENGMREEWSRERKRGTRWRQRAGGTRGLACESVIAPPPTHRRVRHVDKGGETDREEKAR